MRLITVEGAEITIVVHDNIENYVMKALGIVYDGDVFVPGIFSSRHDRLGWSGIMRQFIIILDGRKRNIIIPHNNLRSVSQRLNQCK
uniref:Uncharacterized protein n=1 Tax=Panagrolaimus davidi TaxID=227884 RepID=A0A914R4X0_9BILA